MGVLCVSWLSQLWHVAVTFLFTLLELLSMKMWFLPFSGMDCTFWAGGAQACRPFRHTTTDVQGEMLSPASEQGY